METPGSSTDGLGVVGDTQLCVAPSLEFEHAEHQMLGFSLSAGVPSVCIQEQGQRVSGSAPGGAGAAATMGKDQKLTRRLLMKDE